MISTLTLPDGQKVQLGERTPSGSKNDTRYGTLETGRPVVVKVQANHGQLAREAVALTFAASQGLPSPTVVASGTTESGEYFLVLTRENGVRPTDPDGWQRMGRDYARLASATITHCPLPTVQAEDFAADHTERLLTVKSLLTNPMHDQIQEAITRLATNTSLTLTHGDPGSGNYLDNRAGGTILDWETASIAPFGLDVGRAAFIALLDLGDTGIPQQLHTAFVRGYQAALPAEQSISDEVLHAGILVAGLQFAHGRHTRPLRADRTPHMVIDALTAYLEAR